MSLTSNRPWPDDDPRLLLLSELRDRIGDFLLVGAHARDIVCNEIVGLARPMPSTNDFDVAVAIPARGEDYEDRVSLLDGERFPSRMRFSIPPSTGSPDLSGFPIDVIPYGPGVPDLENIPLDSDRTLDATGMAQAAACAAAVQVHPRLTLQIPPLHALVALKLVAYGLRVELGEHKDARDLDLLMDATCHGRALDDIYAHISVAPEELDYDVDLVGPWLAGVRIRRDFGDRISERAVAACTRELPGHMARQRQQLGAPDRRLRARQLESLCVGAHSQDPPSLEDWALSVTSSSGRAR